MLEVGILGSQQITVSEDKLASVWKSGTLDVFATPAMIALMEQTCANSVQMHLDAGFSTVGISVNIVHTRATPKGMTVHVNSTLTEIDRKRLVFHVEAFDEKGKIGEGTHERFIIDTEKFMEKVMS
ncbi:MAG: thioesterase family protein [Clostridia bacterium]|nr:thioesterase family protein [Clostridia bacterium]